MWKITNSSECRATLELFWCIGCHSTVLSIRTFIWGPCLWVVTLVCQVNLFHESFVGILPKSSLFIQVIFSHWNWINIIFLHLHNTYADQACWNPVMISNPIETFQDIICIHNFSSCARCIGWLYIGFKCERCIMSPIIKRSTRLVATIIKNISR